MRWANASLCFLAVIALASGQSGLAQYRGRYTNVAYRFSVRIPAGMVGEGNPGDAPNHGFAIQLRQHADVWVDASYDLDEPPKPMRFNSVLGTLKAERKVWRTSEHGLDWMHRSIVARRIIAGEAVPIIYRIQVNAAVQYGAQANKLFEALVASFRTF